MTYEQLGGNHYSHPADPAGLPAQTAAELLGYLALEHLTGKVKVVSFAGENAAGAAALSGAVGSAYVYGVPAAELTAKGYHPLVSAEQIAKLGIPGLDVIAVATSVVKSDPALVQDYVRRPNCQHRRPR